MPRGVTVSPEKQAEREAAKRDRFLENAGRRVQRILEDFRQLQNCSNTANYSYTDTDVNKMLLAISQAYNNCKSAYEAKSESKKETFRF